MQKCWLKDRENGCLHDFVVERPDNRVHATPALC